MSRIGKKPITIEQGIEVKIDNFADRRQKITIKGPKGELSFDVPSEVKIEQREGNISVYPQMESKNTKAIWGLVRALIANMVKGVKDGYEKKLEIEGVGYGATVKGDELELKVGYINTLKIKAPAGIKFLVEKNVITVSGINKELVGQIAADVRKAKPAEPYKGKGIKYFGETIRRKVGKRVAATAGAGGA